MISFSSGGVLLKYHLSLFSLLIMLEKGPQKCFSFLKNVLALILNKENHNSFMHSVPCIYGHMGVNSLSLIYSVSYVWRQPTVRLGWEVHSCFSRVFSFIQSTCIYSEAVVDQSLC